MAYLKKEDLKIGLEIFIAHPFYGIDHCTVKSEPKLNESVQSLFIEVDEKIQGEIYKLEKFLNDMGINEHTYNNRRTFATLQEAEDYVQDCLNDPNVLRKHAEHLELCEHLNDYDSEF